MIIQSAYFFKCRIKLTCICSNWEPWLWRWLTVSRRSSTSLRCTLGWSLLSTIALLTNAVNLWWLGGRVVDGNHGDGDGWRWATVLQRASAASDETGPRHATATTQEHTTGLYTGSEHVRNCWTFLFVKILFITCLCKMCESFLWTSVIYIRICYSFMLHDVTVEWPEGTAMNVLVR